MAKRDRLAAFLKKHREKSNLSQARVAELLGYSTPQFISNWERGISSPPLDKLAKLMSVYGASENDVIEIIVDSVREDLQQKIRMHRRS